MRKGQYISLALLATTGSAFAQSSVTLFGVVDVSLQRVGGSVGSVTRLKDSGLVPSRVGFRGVEDLGGGMSASFWLEAGLNNDNGTGQASNTNNQANGQPTPPGLGGGQGLTFNRRSTVSLAGNWGELRLGRDYTPTFWNYAIFDPHNLVGVGTNQAFNSAALVGPFSSAAFIRTSNSIGYFLPRSLGGFYGQLQYALGENASNTATADDGRVWAVRLGYANGPVDVAAAASRAEYAAGDSKLWNIAGAYNFGLAKVSAGYYRNDFNALRGRGTLLGVIVPVGPHEIHAAWGTFRDNTAGSPKSSKFSIGYQHNLSKRTALYATVARVKNSGGATQTVFGPSGPASGGAVTGPNTSSSGFDIGIRHAF